MIFYVTSVENRTDTRTWFEQQMVETDDRDEAHREGLAFAKQILRPVGTRQVLDIYGPFELSLDNKVIVQAIKQ